MDADDPEATRARRAEEPDPLRALYQSLPLPSYTWQRTDDDFILVAVNPAAEAFTDGSVSKLLSSRASDLYGDEPDILEDFARCLGSRDIVRRSMHYRLRSTGRERDLDVTYAFLPPDIIVVHTEDITEHRRAEEALQRSRTDHGALFRSVPVAIIVFDGEGRIVEINEQANVLFGYDEHDLIGSSVEVLLPERFRQAHVTHRTRYGANPYTRLMGTSLSPLFGRGKDGREFPVDVALKALRSDAGMRIVASVRDISERKRMEANLEQATEDLEGRVGKRVPASDAYFLTGRELSVLRLIAEGKTDKEIADVLGIRPLTASKHVTNILSKMHAASRTEAGVRAVREGLVS